MSNDFFLPKLGRQAVQIQVGEGRHLMRAKCVQALPLCVRMWHLIDNSFVVMGDSQSGFPVPCLVCLCEQVYLQMIGTSAFVPQLCFCPSSVA